MQEEKLPAFEIYDAYAERISTENRDGLRMILHYPHPSQRKPIEKRLESRPDFGVQVFEQLNARGWAELATIETPMRPLSAGYLFVTDDNKLIVHRRDPGARVHSLEHSLNAGYTETVAHAMTADGLASTAKREASEELLLLSRETSPSGMPYLLVPRGWEPYAKNAARKLGLHGKIRIRTVDIEVEQGTDILEVYDYNGRVIFTTRALLDMMYDDTRSMNAIWIAHLTGIHSDEILPADAEGMPDEQKGFKFFGRETYLIPLEDFETTGMMDQLGDHVKIYKTNWVGKNGARIPRPEENRSGYPVDGKPGLYRGPIGTQVSHPQIFYADNLLARTLSNMTPAYNWREIQLGKERASLARGSAE